jgi:hypothetical protein
VIAEDVQSLTHEPLAPGIRHCQCAHGARLACRYTDIEIFLCTPSTPTLRDPGLRKTRRCFSSICVKNIRSTADRNSGVSHHPLRPRAVSGHPRNLGGRFCSEVAGWDSPSVKEYLGGTTGPNETVGRGREFFDAQPSLQQISTCPGSRALRGRNGPRALSAGVCVRN